MIELNDQLSPDNNWYVTLATMILVTYTINLEYNSIGH